MIIDFHTHIFSSDICRDRTPFLGDGQFRAIYSSEKSKLAGHQELIGAMNRAGVDYAVAMGFPWENEAICEVQNEYLRSVVGLSGGAIVPFGSVPVHASVRVEEWVRRIGEMGLRGVGEVGFYRQGITPATIDFLWELLAAVGKYSLPLCLHVNEPVGHAYQGKYDPGLRELYGAISEFPDVTVILSHWGGGMIFYELMPEVSKGLAHCYYDTAASPYLYSDIIYRIAPLMAGSKKLLFGSDYPLLPHERYLDAVNRELADEELKADILGRNAARLLKII